MTTKLPKPRQRNRSQCRLKNRRAVPANVVLTSSIDRSSTARSAVVERDSWPVSSISAHMLIVAAKGAIESRFDAPTLHPMVSC